MTEHETQHPDAPTWCIHCGLFQPYFADCSCVSEQKGEFDSRVPEISRQMYADCFRFIIVPEAA